MTKKKHPSWQAEKQGWIYKDAPADLLKPPGPEIPDEAIKAELLRRLDLAREYFALAPPPSADHEHRQWALIETVFPNAFSLSCQRGRKKHSFRKKEKKARAKHTHCRRKLFLAPFAVGKRVEFSNGMKESRGEIARE